MEREAMKAFEELIANAKKRDYAEYLRDEMKEEQEQIKKGIEFIKELDSNFREKLEKNELEWKVKTVPENMLEWANKELNKGNVSAVDGTSMYPIDLISGAFCQVGVGGLSYTNDEPSINVQSITSHISDEITAGEFFGELIFGREESLTKRDIAGVMQYWELEHCLSRKEKWVLKDGPIIPRELLSSDVGVELLTNILTSVNTDVNVIGVIKGSKSPKYRLLGRFLRKGEYMVIENTSDFYINVLTDVRGSIGGVTQNARKLINNMLTSVKRGVFKARDKSFVFEIHEDIFDSGIALIMADSLRSPRGLPFLIDLIDSKLSALFENNIYKDRMYSLLMEHGELTENIDERELRSW